MPISQSQNGFTYEAALNLLPRRGFGGADVAESGLDDADDLGFFVDGPLASGALEAMQWFRDRIDLPQKNICSLLFLVGAPGNGKSYIAGEIQKNLTQVNALTRLKHHRKHEYRHENGQKIVVINDATIPTIGVDRVVSKHSLIDDVGNAIQGQDLMLVNVNRGILFEELQAFDGTEVSRSILQWISSPELVSMPAEWKIDVVSSEDQNPDDAITCAVFSNDKSDLKIHVVSVQVDSYSMLEQPPEVTYLPTTDRPFPQMRNSYKVKRFKQRSSDYCSSTAAGILLEKFFESSHFVDPSENEKISVDPFAANLENFRKTEFQCGFQNILRAAELVSSQKITYRKLWGSIAVALVGTLENPVVWLEANQPEIQPGRQRLNDLLRLASYRSHQSIFGASMIQIGETCLRFRTPITSLTEKVDPATDAVPGDHLKTSEGWASYVLEAFLAQSEGESILSAMEELMQESMDSALTSITGFDRQLDSAITDALNGETNWLKDNEKRILVAWYGEYLLRLYALSHGIPAFQVEVQKLTESWADARRNKSLDMETEKSLRTLLLPFYSEDSNKSVFLPLYNARTQPVVNRTESPKLVLRTRPDLNFKVETVGDSIFIELSSGANTVGKMTFDFALLREALTCVENNAGQTELAESLVPRIERFRSSMLHNNASSGFYSVYGPKIEKITFD